MFWSLDSLVQTTASQDSTSLLPPPVFMKQEVLCDTWNRCTSFCIKDVASWWDGKGSWDGMNSQKAMCQYTYVFETEGTSV